MSEQVCTCARIHIGMQTTEHRNWNPDCPAHPWSDRLQAQSDLAVAMQKLAGRVRRGELSPEQGRELMRVMREGVVDVD